MPELAEVEFFRKRWQQAASGQRVLAVQLHATAKIFRGTDPTLISERLQGAKFVSSEAAAKQMLFRFSGRAWLGVHLGMTGDLKVQPPDYVPAKHDHLVLKLKSHQLVFSDPRMFGRVQFSVGASAPRWWSQIAPAILSAQFTAAAVGAFLERRARTPIKAVLLMQERFPGVGNWMADEILWRAALHPKRLSGSLTAEEIKTLWKECRWVCREALVKIAGRGKSLPAHLNLNIPETWLFRHRWRAGGRCPLTGVKLVREEVGGRTTCWSPARQKLAPNPRRAATRKTTK
jgi:formamidopyrimidine-DNA glycosylase